MLIFSIDGLNRAGKTTQLLNLKNKFNIEGISSLIFRGDGTRTGSNNSDYYDPYSAFWQQVQHTVFKTDDTFNQKIWTECALKLENEINDCVARNTNSEQILLLDRSRISRYFVLKQHNQAMPNSFFQNDYQNKPNIFFVLDVPKNVLLDRIEMENTKDLFRKTIILKYYDLFQSTIEELTENSAISNQIIRIDGTNPPIDITKIIYKKIMGYIDNRCEI